MENRLPTPQYGRSQDETIQNLFDAYYQLKKIIEYMMDGNLSHGNLNLGDMLDSKGIDPKYLDPFKNFTMNSSFETFNSSLKPLYWSFGVVTADSNFSGSYSLKLGKGESTTQESGAIVNPAWYDFYKTRLTFHKKQGKLKVEILDTSNNNTPLLLTDTNGTTSTSIVFAFNRNWDTSRCTLTFDPGNSTGLKIRFTNIDDTYPVYIDCVHLHPDYTNKPVLYKDGPRSTGYKGSEVRPIFVLTKAQRAAKTDFEDKDVTIVTDDPTRHDIILKSATTTLTAEESESVILCDGTFTVNLPTAVGNDEISYTIKNKGAGTITIDPSGTETIDGAATKTLAANEKAKIISDGSNWWVI